MGREGGGDSKIEGTHSRMGRRGLDGWGEIRAFSRRIPSEGRGPSRCHVGRDLMAFKGERPPEVGEREGWERAKVKKARRTRMKRGRR